MSHDQRPARMRVVADAGAARGNAVQTKAETDAKQGNATAPTKPGGLPILPALLFVIACAIGGALIPYLLGGAH